MTTGGSYDVRDVAADVPGEIARLRAQVELFWPKEFKRYRDLGLRDGMAVAELGCGPGFVLEHLIRELPRLDLCGVDIDELLVAEARRILAGHDRIRVHRASIDDTGLAADSLDFVIVRLVLEHLSDPAGALREIRRILRPGGRVVVLDNDFGMHDVAYPDVPELRELYDAYSRSRVSLGGDPWIGRLLPSLLRDAGFTDLDFDAVSAHSGIVGDEAFARSEGLGIPSRLVRDGFLSSKSMGQIARQWREMQRHPDHAVVRQLFLGSGRKPAGIDR